MASKEKKQRLYSRAEIVSLVGFLIFTVLTYIGFSFNHQIVESGLFTVLIVGGAFFAIQALLRMKKAETRLGLWRAIEISTAIVVLVMFVLFGNQPLYKALSSVSKSGKSVLQPAATRDLDKLESIFNTYESQENNAIVEVANSLRQVTGLGNSRFDDNARYHLECHFGTTNISDSDIENYRHSVLESRFLSMNQDGELVAGFQQNDYMTFKTETMQKIARIRSAVNSWSIMMVPQISSVTGDFSIQKLCVDVPSKLTEMSHLHQAEGYPLKFTLARSSSDANKWTVGDVLEYDYPAIPSDLSSKMDGFTTISPFFWGILINLLMAFAYLMAYRSKKVRRKRSDRRDLIGGGRL